ncbi:MAG: hypothetical protein QXU08_08155 [Ignisphaera sp.]
MEISVEKKEAISFLSDISKFLTPTYLGIGCVGLVRSWNDADFIQLDAVFQWVPGTAMPMLIQHLVFTLSLIGISLLVFASVYHLTRVYRYIRFITPVSARRLYVIFSLLFAGSSTAVGLLAPYIAMSKLMLYHEFAHSWIIQTIDVVSMSLLGLSFLVLGLSVYAVGRQWWEGRGFGRVFILFLLLTISLPIYPLGMMVASLTLLLAKVFVARAVAGETVAVRIRAGAIVVGVLLCIIIILSVASSVAIQGTQLVYSLPVCPNQIPVNLVHIPIEDSSKRVMDFILVIANPAKKELVVSYPAISLTIDGVKQSPIPMDIPYFSTDTYSIQLLYCNNCGQHLAPHTTSLYMYRVEFIEKKPTTVTLEFEAVIGVSRKGYIYVCGRYVENNLLVVN